jgi:IS1 family transposase
MANKLSHEKRQLVLRLLCEGNSIRSTSRITGCHKTTIASVILAFGQAAKVFLDETLRGLTLNHLECDEIWSFVLKKQSRLTMEERETRGDIGDVYLFTAIDKETKLLPTFVVGKRTADNCRRFMVDLASRLVMPKPGAGDAHSYVAARQVYITQISTDDFPGYPEAVDLAFGGHAKFGTIIKEYKNATMAYTPSEMVGTKKKGIVGIDKFQSKTICTSHVERNNGTLRTFIKRFTRLTNAFSKKLENHEAAIATFVAYYNFVWRTRHSDRSGKAGKLRPTAAMMAKVTDHLWSFDEFYDTVIRFG